MINVYEYSFHALEAEVFYMLQKGGYTASYDNMMDDLSVGDIEDISIAFNNALLNSDTYFKNTTWLNKDDVEQVVLLPNHNFVNFGAATGEKKVNSPNFSLHTFVFVAQIKNDAGDFVGAPSFLYLDNNRLCVRVSHHTLPLDNFNEEESWMEKLAIYASSMFNTVPLYEFNKSKGALIVNLFGVPGAGKSTAAAYIFSELKMRGVNAELVTEFAKDKVWERNDAAFDNQAYIFGKQSYRISRCFDQVDVIVTDSPLPLSIFYNHDKRLTENFNASVMDVFNSYNNINYLLNRVKPYNPKGRFQTEEESNALAEPVKDLLTTRNIPFTTVNGDKTYYDRIIDTVMNILKEQREDRD